MPLLRYASVLSILAWVCSAAADSPVPLPNPFFAFSNCCSEMPLDEQVEWLADLGYAGIGWSGTERIPEALRALDARQLRMVSLYVVVNVDPGAPPYDPGLKAAMEHLHGRDTVIWLQVNGGTPSANTSDDRAVPLLREIAAMADAAGLRVALYPHVGCYVARVEDAVRLAKKVDRANLEVTFNLCHFLKLDDEKNLSQRIRDASPHLFMVSINGADRGDTNQMPWDRLIQPLDRGSFDVGKVGKALRAIGYTGPVGLQCYGISGNPRENLKRSMAMWKRGLE